MTGRVDFQSRVPIGHVRVGDQTYPVLPSGEMVRQLRVVRDSVNAVESGLAASEVANVPAGSIAATTVQAAIDELDTEKASVASVALKANIASPAFTGTPTAPTAASSTSTTQIATTAFVMSEVSSAVTGLLDLKGDTDASSNPNYPAASKGDTYYVTVAGKVGGASGKSVQVGDVYIAKADNAGGTEAAVGTSWFVLEKNQNFDNVTITGGSIEGTPIGAATPDTGKFSSVESTGYVKSGSTVVGSLPSAVTVGAGTRYFVTDANATTFLSVVAGGGVNSVPVVSDGTNWLIG